GWTLPEPFELTFPLRGADGNYRWFLTRCVPIVNATGKITNWVGTNTDINDQVLAEEKIKESENMFRTLADTLPQLIWMTDEKGKYMYASAQWYEYTGVNPSLENASEQFVHPADMQALLKVWKNSLQSGATYYAEARLKSKHGEYRWHFVKGEPVKSDDGKVIKWIGAFTDINDQKTLNQKLEQLVTERTRELARSNEDLQQFAHVASHDLKEPVRKVRTFISRMQVEFGNELPERVKTYLSKIEGAANRMYAMIDGVLLYSTLSTGEKAFEQIDLNETISSIASDLEVLIYQKDAVIEYDHLPTFQGSPILIYQLFYNLLTNSLKFTSPNTKPFITIKSETWLKNKELQGNSFKITVRDNGIGFRQDHAEKIFQTFARLNPKDKYEGTGLGLALCKKIVERHSGSISAKGEVGKGACFEIVLPTASVEN
ncbi:MAG TPA: ATP-binding protein, partial [Segetibacter sp.]